MVRWTKISVGNFSPRTSSSRTKTPVTGPPPWPAFFATSHHSLDREAFYIQSHLITKKSVDFFTKFVSTGYIWPEGLDTLHFCRRSCHAKIRQGIARAVDLTKLVNDLRSQFNQFTSTLKY